MELLQLLLQEARPAGRGGTLAAAVAGASAGAGGRAPLQATQWRELDPRALMEDAATDHVPNGAGGAAVGNGGAGGRARRRRRSRVAPPATSASASASSCAPSPCGAAACSAPHILEESASDQSGDDDSGRLKHITISLGGGAATHGADRDSLRSASDVSWSGQSDSVA